MNGINSAVRRYPGVCFYLLACGLTWGSIYLPYFLLPAPAFAFLTKNFLPDGLPAGVAFALVGVVSSYGPSLAGVTIAGLYSGRPGIREWLARWVRWRVGWEWYAVALLCAPVLFVIQHLITHPVEFLDHVWGHPSPTGLRDNFAGFFLMTLLYFPYVAGEEGGWRGLAVPRLQERYGPVWASCLIAGMWQAWHWPGGGLAANAFPELGALGLVPTQLRTFLIMILFSMVCTWIFNRTRGSLQPVILWHAATDAMGNIERAIFYRVNPPGHAIGDWILWPIVIAILLWFTRGQLGYDRYQADQAAGG